MQFVVAFLKKIPILPIVLFIVGLVFGLLIGWWVAPVEFKDATPFYLRQDLREDYMRMAIDSYSINKSAALAADRWIALGTEAQNAFAVVQNNPGYLPAALVQEFGQAVTDEITARGGQTTGEAPPDTTPSWMSTALIGVGIILVLGVGGAGGFYLYRLFRKRGSGEKTVAMQAAEISRSTTRMNFDELGVAPPITQTVVTYVFGDDLFDESNSIDSPSGIMLGEYGVGITDYFAASLPKKVNAIEMWLFDTQGIATDTKVLLSEYAFQNKQIFDRLSSKGVLVMAKKDESIYLETKTLILMAKIVDVTYGQGPQPDQSYFDRLILDIAVWQKDEQTIAQEKVH